MAEGSLFYGLVTALHTARACLPTMLDERLGRLDRRRTSRRLEVWADRVVRHTRIDLHVHGAHHVDPRVPYVMMSNHQSDYDIFVLFRAFPAPMRMVAKVELAKVPILGPGMRAGEFVFVDRDDHGNAMAAMELAADKVRSGVAVWISPEGTQSKDGTLLPFKKGGFVLAEETGAPILPITVEGTRHVLPPKSTRPRPGKRVDVTFHAPVDPRAFGDRPAVMDAVRTRIASALGAAR